MIELLRGLKSKSEAELNLIKLFLKFADCSNRSLQGTFFRSWLFLVMINDLKSNMENTLLWKFADDRTLSETVYRAEAGCIKLLIMHFLKSLFYS